MEQTIKADFHVHSVAPGDSLLKEASAPGIAVLQ